MIYRDITYTDYNGIERTDRYYFNLSRADLLRMNFSAEGGLEKRLNDVVASHDNEKIWNLFESIVRESVGVKSKDGKRFDKSPEAKADFLESEAYSELIYMLMSGNYGTDPEYAVKFVNGLINKDILDETMRRVEANGTHVAGEDTEN